ncbi:CRISPR-associated endonuclease Cas6 [Methanobrevibacter thaueri]|uniref:CRISPR associated protein Cas6 n=1 Tax=Methanobrevibacter thaueri TaxID=190975 RepID=A0A315XTB2_9EURY|nr:CRISPR-associated endonuclease Cas6 [Methanobrevibacter thaueri]PWB88369.1 hypothetical protein MBBTH_01000 [Methanobrevibacter thaueri]
MKYNMVNLILKTDLKLTASPTKVRGFIGNNFKEYPILHNHYANDKFLYSYPYVQYKIINGDIVIVGIDEGADLIKKIAPELSTLSLDKEYKITEKLIHEKEVDIKPSSEEKHYKFITPWLGLNQNNYQKYTNVKDWKEKKEILNRVLVGNLLSMSKGLGIIVNKRLYAKTHFEEKIVEYKGVKMNAFIGEFKVHYDIPDYFGLGKGVSQGFGCVKQIFDEE